MKWFSDKIKEINELRAAYKKLLVKYHPDNHPEEDTTSIVQEINSEYSILFQQLKNAFEQSREYESTSERTRQTYDYSKDEKIREMIQKLVKYASKDILIEICGTWIWVSGNTKPIKEELKVLNLHYAKGKKAWYIHYDDYYRYSSRGTSLSYIRDKYGSVVIKKGEDEEKKWKIASN